jgi:hypothetical protein
MGKDIDLRGMSVLVPEAHALGMLAAIRSLGRAGYRVHAASPRPGAIGFASRYCSARTICPPFGTPAYVEWLRSFVAQEGIGAVVPGGAFLLTIEPWFEEFQPLLPVASDRHIVYRALSKSQIFESFCGASPDLRLLDHHPASLLVAREDTHPTGERLAALGACLYLKADARLGAPGVEDLLVGPLEPKAAGTVLQDALVTYHQVLLQAAVTGRQAGVTLLMGRGGQVLAQNCFRDEHNEPTRRGTMSLRRTWDHPALIADAIRRLRHLQWQGAAMLEYRVRDSDGTFDFIELNPRYWQSLHLDLLAGIDFPRLQMAWYQGQETPPLAKPRDVICGDLWPGEISRMLEIWRSARFSPKERLRESLVFLLRLFDWRIASDYAFPGDRFLYWRRVAQVIRDWLGPRA